MAGNYSNSECPSGAPFKNGGIIATARPNSLALAPARLEMLLLMNTNAFVRGLTRVFSGDTTPDPIGPLIGTRGKRKCASEANEKIHLATKRLRRSEGDFNGSSSDSRGSTPEPSGRSAVGSSTRRAGLRQDVDLDFATCENLLQDLSKHADGWPFLKPVGRREAPDYHRIIKYPMDFGTMKMKLNEMKYASNEEFLQDVKLIFENARVYNMEGSDEYEASVNLQKYFTARCRDLGLPLLKTKKFRLSRPLI
ncbi:unnamed protein product [Cyprideis torosa]|uniref:Uncharacterized protein n=1 Tax=Cyprideis torosa TaxID=163714 RepID=A0A7R8ZTE6_9CRUS|nr:unnamed protein product [Cyprideis torosa]CAG0897829.1 unnamed protein product [Cyprideis torosa]